MQRSWLKRPKAPQAKQRMIVISGADDLPSAVLRRSQSVLKFHTGEKQRGATSFLVQHNDDGTSLMLTNHHVVHHGNNSKHYIEAADGSHLRPLAIVASSKELDYAIVRVSTSKSIASLSPIQLSQEAMPADVYSIGFPNAGKLMRDSQLSSAALTSVFTKPAGGYSTLEQAQLKTVQLGQVGGRESKYSTAASLPGYHGSSGSPVLSARSHGLVGLTTMGASRAVVLKAQGDPFAAWDTSFVTSKNIREHLQSTQSQRTGSARSSIATLLASPPPNTTSCTLGS